MSIKRAPPNNVLSFNDLKKLTTLVSLFITIHQKNKRKKSKDKKNDKTKSKYYDCGPQINGPLFIIQLVFI